MNRFAVALALAPAFAFLSPGPALAREDPLLTGNAFLRLCDKPEHAVSCITYTLGVFHGFREGSSKICLPKGVDTGQLREVGKKFMRDNPQYGHFGPGGLMVASWTEAFPCTKLVK
jgi:hypothetical protein